MATQLRNLILSNNSIDGLLPTVWSQKLARLDLSLNKFSGTIPPALPPMLEYLCVGGIRVRVNSSFKADRCDTIVWRARFRRCHSISYNCQILRRSPFGPHSRFHRDLRQNLLNGSLGDEQQPKSLLEWFVDFRRRSCFSDNNHAAAFKMIQGWLRQIA